MVKKKTSEDLKLYLMTITVYHLWHHQLNTTIPNKIVMSNVNFIMHICDTFNKKINCLYCLFKKSTILVQYWNTILVQNFYTSIVDNTGIPVLRSPTTGDPGIYLFSRIEQNLHIR